MPYNTGNPIGSEDPRDLIDNAAIIDKFATSEEATVLGRLGDTLRTMSGMSSSFGSFLASAGYQFLGDYEAGIEVTAYNQVIRESGEFWRAAALTELPYTTTGAGMPESGMFVSVGDAVLRQEVEQRFTHVTLRPLAGETNAMPRIVNAFAIADTVYMVGTFPITETCSTTLVNKQLIGLRGHTNIICDASMTGVVFNVSDEGLIKDLTITGPMVSEPDVTDGVTYANTVDEIIALKGVGALTAIKTQRQSSKVIGCEITRFPGWAIETAQNNAIGLGAKGLDSNIKDNRIAFNFGGINILEESEYMKYLNNSICWNVYGVYKRGGNNTLTGGNTDHNRVNFVTRGGANNSHGSITGGTMNHGKLAAIVADEITNGEAITGVNIFDAGPLGIYIRKSIGLNIAACLLGRVNFYCEGLGTVGANPGVNLIQHNTFNLHGVTYQIYDDWNPATGMRDPVNTPDNCIFRGNEHMEGKASRGLGTWDSAILNDRDALDDDGFIWRELEAGNINSRVVAGRPIDAQKYLGNGNQTGAIRIKLPVPGFNNSNIRMKVNVSVSNRLGCTLDIGAFAGTGATWSSPIAYDLKGASHEVRFGASASGELLVYIGDLTTQWSSALVSVEWLSMHGGAWSLSRYWKRKWVVGLESSAFENVTQLIGSPSQFVGNLNDIDYDIELFAGSGATNKPGAVTGWVETKTRGALPGSTIRMQRFVEAATNKLFVRTTATGNAGWTAWAEK